MRSSAPLVSIAIPARNAGPYIGDALRSVFAQTYMNWELLIADDGSTDGSMDRVRAIKDDRLRVLMHTDRRGGGARLNELVGIARGAYLARLDADDLMHPRRIERQVGYLEAHPEIDVLGSAMISFVDRDTLAGNRSQDLPTPYTRASVLAGSAIAGAPVTAKTSFYRANPYDPSYVGAEDFELWCRVGSDARIAVLAENLYFYRELYSRDMRKYAAMYLVNDRILRTYGPPEVGSLGTLSLRLRNGIGVIVLALAIGSGQQSWLIRRRNRPLSPSAAAEAHAALKAIRATRLPGLD